MTAVGSTDPQQCPRCHGPLALFDGDTGGRSRSTPGRSVPVCGICCQDEAVRQAAGEALVPPAGWPGAGGVPDGLAYRGVEPVTAIGRSVPRATAEASR
ncbi:hypothetical protein ACIOJE_35050 [Kitasatospora sp. NPDC087861]|uniref:hypothetical protein n=1 Tax=Kitasatospora sp. NPDC087861 TaxID=3364070 RepID=UPI003815E1CB